MIQILTQDQIADEIEQKVLYPLFDFLSQQRFDLDEITDNNQNPANRQGRLWEKFITNKIDLFIESNKHLIQNFEGVEIKENYTIEKINNHNFSIVEKGIERSELDGLYLLYNNSCLIVECKSNEKPSKLPSKAQKKRRLVENATGKITSFLKIRPTNNESLGLITIGRYNKKMLLKMPIELEKIRIENCQHQKQSRENHVSKQQNMGSTT